KGYSPKDDLIVICNFTPTVHNDYRIGVHRNTLLNQVFNTDSLQFGGSGISNDSAIPVEEIAWNGRPYSAAVTLAPLAVTVFTIQ
ncbi:MAG TPA: alpha amylase C-terminal domain-containing protein, partial [Flavobacterium sp.]|nr:alpha amylase C-terminal domain-containing protein [Flavobacterium sp.]